METTQAAGFGDAELVQRAQRGEREAFEQLMERYKRKAYRIAFDFTRDREEAKDLSQEAFLRAYTHLPGFDGRSSFYTWLYRIVVNVCLDYRRRKLKVAWEPFDEKAERAASAEPRGQSDPDRAAMAGEVSRKVARALEALPPKQRTAFILRNHQDLPIQEIAKIMRTAEGTVKAHLHRAVVALRQTLAELI